MTRCRVTIDGNTYAVSFRGRSPRAKVIGGMWTRGKAQNLTRAQFARFLLKMWLAVSK